MDQQTLTDHQKAMGGCGYVAMHPLIAQENDNQNGRPETQKLHQRGGGTSLPELKPANQGHVLVIGSPVFFLTRYRRKETTDQK